MNYINEVSFAAYDALLFLDTHPDDADALAYFRKHSRMRNAALKEYERLYGPLTLDTARDSIHDSFSPLCVKTRACPSCTVMDALSPVMQLLTPIASAKASTV